MGKKIYFLPKEVYADHKDLILKEGPTLTKGKLAFLIEVKKVLGGKLKQIKEVEEEHIET